MATWPATLPNPLLSGHELETTDSTARTDMEGGPARVRRRSTAAPDHITLRFQFDEAQMAIFRDFWENDFLNGAAWCDVPLKDGRAPGPALHACRPLAGKFKASPISQTYWLVEFQVEVRNA